MTPMTPRIPAVLALTAAVALAGCTAPPGPGQTRAGQGAAAGALLGGFTGLATRPGDTSPLVAGAAGAIIGAAIGGAIGTALDRQAADLRRDIGNPDVRIVNTGGSLVVTMPQDILFDTGSAALRPDLQTDLRAVAANLLQYPQTRVEVIGHTDSTGSAAYNADLSQRRASAVASVLIGAGVPAGRVIATGRGEMMPVATNLTEQGRALNRRVELVIRPL
jgi:outer membrane protein OmpA-like peptidoglycan-associated protein